MCMGDSNDHQREFCGSVRKSNAWLNSAAISGSVALNQLTSDQRLLLEEGGKRRPCVLSRV